MVDKQMLHMRHKSVHGCPFLFVKHLSFGLNRVTYAPCRYTSFIARTAGKTAKCWCDRPTGRAPLAPIVARPSWLKNCPSSLPPPPKAAGMGAPAVRMPRPARCAPPAPAAGAVRTAIEPNRTSSRDSEFPLDPGPFSIPASRGSARGPGLGAGWTFWPGPRRVRR